MKALFSHRNVKPQVMTWATFPGATKAPPGLYFFSDVGINGSFWYNSGTSIAPVAPIVLHRLLVPFTTTNGTAEEVFSVSPAIPAGVLDIGRLLDVDFVLNKSASAETISTTLKLGTNADGKTGAVAISSVLSLSGSNRSQAFYESNVVLSTTTVQQGVVGDSAIPWTTSTSMAGATPRTVADMAANAMYVSLTCIKTTGGIETATCPYFNVVLS